MSDQSPDNCRLAGVRRLALQSVVVASTCLGCCALAAGLGSCKGKKDTGADEDGGIVLLDQCVGAEPACSTLTEVMDCLNQEGCQSEGSCAGTAVRCETLTTKDDCVTNFGCFWEFVSCEGTVRPCSALTDERECWFQKWCTWSNGACSGEAVQCHEVEAQNLYCLDQQGCESTHGCTAFYEGCADIPQPHMCDERSGCSWADGPCVGSATPCGAFDSANCRSQQGCSLPQKPPSQPLAEPYQISERSFGPLSLAGNGTGFGVAWAMEYQVHFLRLDASGWVLGPASVVVSEEMRPANPALVWTGSAYGLAWVGGSYPEEVLHLTLLGPEGQKLGDDIALSAGAAFSSQPLLVSLSTGFGVIFGAQVSGDRFYYLQLADLDGQPRGPEVEFAPFSDDPVDPLLAETASGLVVAWDTGFGVEPAESYLRRLDPTGAPLGDPVSLTVPGFHVYRFRNIVADGDNVTALFSGRFDTDPSYESRLFFARFDENLALLGTPVELTDGVTESALFSSANGFSALWEYAGTLTLTCLDSAGQSLGQPTVHASPDGGTIAHPSAAPMGGNGKIAVIWNQGGGYSDVFHFASGACP